MEKILYPNRMQSPLRIAEGLVCVVLGLLVPIEPGFFRLLAVAAGIALMLPGFGSLKLDESGFTFRNLFGAKTMPWTDIDSFLVITQRVLYFIPVNRMVGWRLTKAKRPMVLRATGLLVPYDAVFPNTYGMKAAELAALLEVWRVRAATRAGYEPKVTTI